MKPRDGAAVNADPEKGAPGKREERKLVLIGPMYAGLGAALAACTIFCCCLKCYAYLLCASDFMSSGIRVLLAEYALDGNMTRFALLVTLPVIYCVSIVRPYLPFHTILLSQTCCSSSAFNSSATSALCAFPTCLLSSAYIYLSPRQTWPCSAIS